MAELIDPVETNEEDFSVLEEQVAPVEQAPEVTDPEVPEKYRSKSM